MKSRKHRRKKKPISMSGKNGNPGKKPKIRHKRADQRGKKERRVCRKEDSSKKEGGT